MHSNRSSSPSSTSVELEEPLGDSQVGADSTTERAAEINDTDISGCEKQVRFSQQKLKLYTKLLQNITHNHTHW